MVERPNAVTFKGQGLTLIGELVDMGDAAPDFEALATDLSSIGLAAVKNKATIILSVPSLDTSVCDMEAQRFNQEAAKFGDDLSVLLVSMDLPFAQQRWAGDREVDKLTLASDHLDAAFGRAYGVLIKELRLLARAVWVLDAGGVVKHMELVKEVTDEPDYDAALSAARALL